MAETRRKAFAALLAIPVFSKAQQDPQQNPDRRLPIPDNQNEDIKLPNGKSQKDAIAKQEHEQMLKDADELVSKAQQLRDELQKAGDYVVPVSAVKRTEDIERLAKRIRGKLQR